MAKKLTKKEALRTSSRQGVIEGVNRERAEGSHTT